MPKKHVSGSFIASAIAIASVATALEGTDFTSAIVDVQGIEEIAVQIETTGSADVMTGTVTAYFAASPTDTPAWDTFNLPAQAFASASFDPVTDDPERHTAIIKVRGVHSLKLIAIENGASAQILANVHYGKNQLVL